MNSSQTHQIGVVESLARSETISVTEAPDWLLPSDQFEALTLDRDLSWLEFNRRVLHQAVDARTPLLERVKFLSIFSMNLDEFYMKRVGMHRRRAQEEPTSGGSRLNSSRLLDQIRATVLPMLQQQADCFREIRELLQDHGVVLLDLRDWGPHHRRAASKVFQSRIFSALTPQVLDPGHPFPFLSNLSRSIGVVLRPSSRDEPLFARLKIPSGVNLPQPWIRLKEAESEQEPFLFVRMVDVILDNLESIFPEMMIVSVTQFRVARNAEVLQTEEAESESLRETIAEVIRQRRFERVVRLEFAANPDPWVRDLLVRQFALAEDDVYEMPGELDYTGLNQVTDLNLTELRYRPWDPVVPAALFDPETDLFSVIRSTDLLVHHPYESFDATVEQFIRTAADDPQVVAIKMTVYRVGDDTPFVRSLIRAAENGKQVACLIELKARFDEERNLHWARELEKVGAHVVYGIVGLKTHSKTALVVRQEEGRLVCYAHIGTGNYHVKTARLYTDVGLLTADPEITGDLVHLFNDLTGRSRYRDYRRLLIAPSAMRRGFLDLIAAEIAHAKQGRPARIVAQMNQLEDNQICRGLASASQAGVPIDLLVRGFCTLRPGVEGMTETIRIRSIIGRYLEHARIFHFANGSDDPLDGLYFIGSADWMSRNLSNRVETVTPIGAKRHKERLWEILQVGLRDRHNAWCHQPDGTYVQLQPDPEGDGPESIGTHQYLMEHTLKRTALDLQANL